MNNPKNILVASIKSALINNLPPTILVLITTNYFNLSLEPIFYISSIETFSESIAGFLSQKQTLQANQINKYQIATTKSTYETIGTGPNMLVMFLYLPTKIQNFNFHPEMQIYKYFVILLFISRLSILIINTTKLRKKNNNIFKP